MLLRRSLLLTSALTPVLLLPQRALALTLRDLLDKDGRDAEGKRLGDDGFLHPWLHVHYQKYFPAMSCPCHDGECRPSDWQRDQKEPRILQAWINGAWVSADESTKIRDNRSIPADFPPILLEFKAHACAYISGGVAVLTCLWVLDAGV